MFRLSYFRVSAIVVVVVVVVVVLVLLDLKQCVASARTNDADHWVDTTISYDCDKDADYDNDDKDPAGFGLTDNGIGSGAVGPVRSLSDDEQDWKYISDNNGECAEGNNRPEPPRVDSSRGRLRANTSHSSSLGEGSAGDSFSVRASRRPNYSRRPNHSRRPNNSRRSQFSLVQLVCPKVETDTSHWSDGARLYLHLPGKKKELIIKEVKGGRWRKEDVDSWVKNGFDVKKPTLWYMGGWMQTEEVLWLEMARTNYDELVRKNTNTPAYNLIICDWENYGDVRYGPSVGWVPHIGRVVANFFTQLIDRHSYKADMVHLVSYSLSTHIAGVAGRALASSGRGQVKQITALDPTGVCFHGPENRAWASRYALKPTDAKLVVARHYDMHEYGAGEFIGGVDIVVNGGKVQPRMYITDKKLKNMVGVVGLANKHHHFSVQHESPPFDPRSDCHEIAYECPSLDSFKKGHCADCGSRNESCYLISTLGNIELGITPADIGYKLKTQMHILTGVSQFCSYHYQVKAQLAGSNVSSSVANAFSSGQFKFELEVDVVARPSHKLDNSKFGKSGSLVFTQLLRLDARIEKFPKQIKLSSSSQAAKLLESVESVAINFMSHVSAEQRARGSFRYCPDKSSKNLLVKCTDESKAE